ncbi:hypothetical protein BDQ12DRAFT_753359 [Crucibulum laeve]|uniref:AAA+ ATPase domain-containing protein n=1 Tax=Crucibulum laeve TaxID=68775 RepID=A0A5C3LX58_9AGAR|nr:hypothetical protein BDQ12DRAFT_753359 [Crucibulum laeve]
MSHVRNLKAPSKAENLLQYGELAARMLKEIAEATGAPYLKTIAGLTTLIIQTVETVRHNRDECLRMTECTYELVCAIINICKNTEAELSPAMVRNIEHFEDTLHKLLSYVQSHVITAVTLAEMQEQASQRHQEVMDALSSKQAALPPGTTLNDLRRSSSSLSLLPASPQIFSGRDKERQEIITTMQKNTAARICILGPGGIGKTSLGLSVLHDHNIVDIFDTRRYFISCDAAITTDGLISIVAKYFNLEEKIKQLNAIIRYLNRSKQPALIIFDNFETPWEILEHRSKVEDFLALFADIPHLSIVLTMRGVERPSKIRWTRPFLAPLEPLTNNAAEEIFRDIADIDNDDPDLLELLKLTDNLPLAVTLMAHLAETETCASVLLRWKQENTSLLSNGMDKISSLEKSISISISSPRMSATPDALELLSLLALLPDGLSEETLLQMKLPLDNVMKCRFILVSTSLAYVDGQGRVKALTPIREYICAYHPLQNSSLQSLNIFIHQMLGVLDYHEYLSKQQIVAISNEIGNIYSVLNYNLQFLQDYSKDDFREVKSMISLLRFTNQTAMGSAEFILSHRSIIKQLGNNKLLQGHFLFLLGRLSLRHITSRDVEKDFLDAYNCFEAVGALKEQVIVMTCLSYMADSFIKASDMARKAVSLATNGSLPFYYQCGAIIALSEALCKDGYIDDALHHLNEQETWAQATGDLGLEIKCNLTRIQAYIPLGRFEEASMLCDHAAHICDALGLYTAIAPASLLFAFSRGALFFLKSEYDHSREPMQKLRQALDSECFHDTIYYAHALHNLVDIEIATGKIATPQMQRNLEKLESMELLSGYDDTLAPLLHYSRSQIYFANGDLKNAAIHCILSLGSFHLRAVAFRSLSLNFLGDIYLKQQEHDDAMNTYILSLVFSLKITHKPFMYQAIRGIGDVFLVLDDINTAISLFQIALNAFIAMDVHRSKGDCMIRLGDIAHQCGELEKAKQLWEGAIPLFRRSEQGKEVIKCENRLEMLQI